MSQLVTYTPRISPAVASPKMQPDTNGANNGLGIAVGLLAPIKEQFPSISYVDFCQLLVGLMSLPTLVGRVRAKRGCGKHPRSIAERVRRTRFSDLVKKLQELVPNMDKALPSGYLRIGAMTTDLLSEPCKDRSPSARRGAFF
ncbi:hypothetical protein C5167_034520 [Papaver somniferum]|uniref:BHLH domain-containing protein n=1 Tax=Papaver somniferum TaxID=3469 RepID=A0A4Y7KD38_PAPSO|nr:hypothetical protein C5167_034520 [Papaver somniferum]